MKDFLRKSAGTIERFNRLMYWVSAVAILLASLILTYEVVMRYFFRAPTIWEIEFSIYLGVLATFLGAAYGLKDRAHINIDIFVRALPAGVQNKLSKITYLLSLLFCILLAYKGWEFWWEALSKGWRSESFWGPPLAIPYFFLPMGITMLCLQFIIELWGLGKPKEGSVH